MHALQRNHLRTTETTAKMTSNRNQRRSHTWARHCGLALIATGALAVAGCHSGHNADVVATVNGHAIMRAELDKTFTNRVDPQQHLSAEESTANRLNILRDMIDLEIFQQRAAKMNLSATNEEVDAKIGEMKAPYTEEQFNERLKASNHTLDELKREVQRAITSEKLLNKEINSKINVTDADVSAYYNQHKAEYNYIETQYHIAQILVTTAPAPQAGNLQNSKATTPEEAKKKIQTLKNRIDSGEDFGGIAMNFSESTQTASNGGDMGFIPESQLRSNPSIYGAIIKLKAGETTDIMPVQDPGSSNVAGYAILKLISREPAGQRTLDDPAVQQQIRQLLREGRSNLLKNAYFEMLRDQSKIENFYAEEVFKNGSH